MIRSRVEELTGNFNKRLLVVGDVMLDRFVWGSVERFSPEAAACPVLDFESEMKMLGGAGNVATNLVSMGADAVHLTGLVGRDPEGRQLQRLAGDGEIHEMMLMGERPTTTKTRYVAEDKHLLRFDREETHPIEEWEAEILLERIQIWKMGGCRSQIAGEPVDAIVIQDYAKGAVTPFLVRELMKMADASNIPVFVDPKSDLWPFFQGAALVKPNLPEAMSAFGVVGKEHEGLVERWGRSMLKYTRAEAVVVTRGKDGMSLFTEDVEAWAVPQPVDVVDVSGAGDTSMATLVLSRLAGATWVEAMSLANAAAGIAVGKRGTSTVTTDELLDRYPKE
jgi:D-beta-D-heptose 7-phosphate kinase/D-beta-D-heptose 1-phosphate adenosyltransferase